MKTVNPAMLAHLQSGRTTLATACKLTRDDGTIMGFTDHDQDVTISAVTYKAKTGFVRSAFSQKSDLSVPNMQLAGVISDAAITDIDLRAGIYDFAKVRFFLFNYADTSMGTIALPGHHLGNVQITDHGFQAEILGLADLLRFQIIRLYLPACDADFADLHGANECKLDPATFTQNGTVTSLISASRQFVADIDGTRAAGFFQPSGIVTWATGANANRAREVKADVLGVDPSRTVTLFLPTPYPIEVGDTFTILAGCNRDGTPSGDCIVKFNNIVNFRGFPDVPGLDSVLQTPSAV